MEVFKNAQYKKNSKSYILLDGTPVIGVIYKKKFYSVSAIQKGLRLSKVRNFE